MATAVDVHEHVRASNDLFCDALKRGAPEEMAEMYTPDGQLMPPGGDFVRGHEAIEDFWRGVLDTGVEGLKLHSVELEVLADTAVEAGRYDLLGPGGTRLDEGKYLVVWKEVRGTWKLHRDIWNSNTL
jgi:uncharacterized protein (TIGR02246 family)